MSEKDQIQVRVDPIAQNILDYINDNIIDHLKQQCDDIKNKLDNVSESLPALDEMDNLKNLPGKVEATLSSVGDDLETLKNELKSVGSTLEKHTNSVFTKDEINNKLTGVIEDYELKSRNAVLKIESMASREYMKDRLDDQDRSSTSLRNDMKSLIGKVDRIPTDFNPIVEEVVGSHDARIDSLQRDLKAEMERMLVDTKEVIASMNRNTLSKLESMASREYMKDRLDDQDRSFTSLRNDMKSLIGKVDRIPTDFDPIVEEVVGAHDAKIDSLQRALKAEIDGVVENSDAKVKEYENVIIGRFNTLADGLENTNKSLSKDRATLESMKKSLENYLAQPWWRRLFGKGRS